MGENGMALALEPSGASSTVGAVLRELARDRRLTAFAVAAVLVFGLSTTLGLGELRGNECDVLPAAKQLMDPSWLRGDWYLNLPIAYRYVFDVPAGLALRIASFDTVALLGRVLVFTCFAAACVSLCRAFRVRLAYCVPWILLFLPHQSLAAGEWIIQSFETKPFAYVAALLGLACLVRRRYAPMAAWLGVALSTHLLIGFYASLCTASCLLLREHRGAWRRVLRWAPWGLATGVAGLAAVVAHLAQTWSVSRVLRERGAEIYVTLRVPHHTLPSAWKHPGLPVGFVVCVLSFVALRCVRSPRHRTLAQYALTAAALFSVGLLLAHAHDTTALRFYWFRFGDTMLPLLGWFALFMLISDAQQRFGGRLWRAVHRGSLVLTLGVPVLCVSAHVAALSWGSVASELGNARRPGSSSASSAMHRWIRRHTPTDARFLVDPSLDCFYVEAERSSFVTFKHSPQSEGDIVEWFSRIFQLNGDRVPTRGGYAAARELRVAYRRLRPERAAEIARTYGLEYMLTDTPNLPFAKVHQEGASILYRLPERPDGASDLSSAVPRSDPASSSPACDRAKPALPHAQALESSGTDARR